MSARFTLWRKSLSATGKTDKELQLMTREEHAEWQKRREKQVARAFARWAGCSLDTVVVNRLPNRRGRATYEAYDAATCARTVYDASQSRLRNIYE